MTDTYSPEAFQQQVTSRLDLLTRWTAAIRHDLGNMLLPSSELTEQMLASTEDSSLRRLHRQITSMREQMEWSRAALGRIRQPSSNDENATEFGLWWTGFAAMGRAIFSSDVHVAAAPATEALKLGVSPQMLSRVIMAVFMAIDLQLDMTAESQVRLGSHGESLRVVVHGVACKTLMLPDAAMDLLRTCGGTMRFGTDGQSACWVDLTLPRA